jgi:hypothetical protein
MAASARARLTPACGSHQRGQQLHKLPKKPDDTSHRHNYSHSHAHKPQTLFVCSSTRQMLFTCPPRACVYLCVCVCLCTHIGLLMQLHVVYSKICT